MNTHTITEATEEERTEILRERKLSYNCERTYYIARLGPYKLLFEYFQRTEGVYELHIACPKDSVVASRALSLSLMRWLFETIGAKAIVTSCPEGKIANMCRKLGARELKQVGGLIYFIATSDQFNT